MSTVIAFQWLLKWSKSFKKKCLHFLLKTEIKLEGEIERNRKSSAVLFQYRINTKIRTVAETYSSFLSL